MARAVPVVKVRPYSSTPSILPCSPARHIGPHGVTFLSVLTRRVRTLTAMLVRAREVIMIDRRRTAKSSPCATMAPVALRCPLCGDRLTVDLCWVSPHWLCPNGHSYSNTRALMAELDERGWLTDTTLLGGPRR